jgi:hypothetical protein
MFRHVAILLVFVSAVFESRAAVVRRMKQVPSALESGSEDAATPRPIHLMKKDDSSQLVVSDTQIHGSLTLNRQYLRSHLDRKPPRAGEPYVVVCVFAGRRDRMHLLMKYLGELLVTGEVSEVNLWDRTKSAGDASYLRTLNETDDVRLFPKEGFLPKSIIWTSIYEHYSQKGDFKPVGGPVAKNDILFVKADDDIVYMDTDRFKNFTTYIAKHPGMFLVHANVVNNGVAAYYQSQHIKELGEQVPGIREYPPNGIFGKLFSDEGVRAVALHRFFLSHRDAFSWEDSTNENCIQFPPGAFSVNFFGARGENLDKIHELVNEGDSMGKSDENALTYIATREKGLLECMFTPFNVAHLAFHPQPKADSMLPEYESLWEGLHGNKISLSQSIVSARGGSALEQSVVRRIDRHVLDGNARQSLALNWYGEDDEDLCAKWIPGEKRAFLGDDPCAQFPDQVDMPVYHGEFGEDLLFSIPVAYFLSTCGKLASTIGCGNMSAYYWFSKNHTDDLQCKRLGGSTYYLAVRATTNEGPKKPITCFADILGGKPPPAWRPAPYLQHYLGKPILTSPKNFMNAPYQLVVINKYNKEWNGAPVNFLDYSIISTVFELFKSTCGKDARILYSHTVQGKAPGESDEGIAFDLNDGAGHTDFDLVESQAHVETIQAVQAAHPDLSSNEVKLRAMTRTQCYLSVQGGSGVPAFYFGGKNIVWHKQGLEGDSFYHKSAPQFSGQEIIVVNGNMYGAKDIFMQTFQEQMLANGCAACSMRK